MVSIQNGKYFKYDLLGGLGTYFKTSKKIKIWINAYIKDEMRVNMVGESPCIYNIS